MAAIRPVALLLGDLHWADEAGLMLLLHLARQTREAGVLLLGTYRDGELARQRPLRAALHELAHERLVERVAVPSLTMEGTVALLEAALGIARVAAELPAFLQQMTEGNPFFL